MLRFFAVLGALTLASIAHANVGNPPAVFVPVQPNPAPPSEKTVTECVPTRPDGKPLQEIRDIKNAVWVCFTTPVTMQPLPPLPVQKP